MVSLSFMAVSIFFFLEHWVIYFFTIFFGITMISMMPACLGLGIELTFPMSPALVNGVMLLFA